MGKDKLRKFAEVAAMDHVIEPDKEEMLHGCDRLRGKWKTEVFARPAPITLELACGKGEYTLALAQRYPERNFIGVDIKGNRIWRGAKTSREQDLSNVAFLRTRIESIDSFFAEDEVDEIWITFPDPQKKSRREKKRLTHPGFLERYRKILRSGGTVNLKTDSSTLYDYTMDVILEQGLKVHHRCIDVYVLGKQKFPDELNEIMETKTHYEQMWLEEGKQIKFISFEL
ncbi:MAG: tRNA (guanosine(46)-N7)-methyltransferase TrmB [Flavobacteriales bacterium]|nr:tRNA (guanosine(46)-N7)-methyltransferase TrmB [Flavobacteriales bacterium]